MIECFIAAKVKFLLDFVRWHFPERIAAVRIGICPIDAGDIVPLHETYHAGPLRSQGQQTGSETIDRGGTCSIDVADHGTDGSHIEQGGITLRWRQWLQCIVDIRCGFSSFCAFGIGIPIDRSHALLDPACGLYRTAALDFA